MKKQTLQLIVGIYEHFNNECIINADKLIFSSYEHDEKYNSNENMGNDLLISINEYIKELIP